MADDDNLELKKRARRRLVGAAALALLAVIVLPMVMDQEPRPLNQDVQIQIPRPEGDNFTAKPIDNRADAVSPVQANPNTPAEPEGASAPVVPAAPTAVPRVPPPKGEPAPKAPVEKTEPSKVPAPKIDAGKAEAILAGQTGSEYVVQLGAYKDSSNVASLRNRLKGDGFSVYTELIADKTRVRVGPYPTREAAEKAANRLRTMGLNGVVTAR
ncbi:MAG: SPOR domain-containing protein [Zoogloeaceae bacterium]|nr:SPOR domain-containing protein [Zoogloeaceae bacterium]